MFDLLDHFIISVNLNTNSSSFGWQNWISTIIAILAVVVSYFSYKTSKKQSNNTIRPYVILEMDNYAKIPGLFSEDSEWYDTKNNILSYSIANLGNGIAENLSVEYSFDYNELIKRIKELDSENIFDVKKLSAYKYILVSYSNGTIGIDEEHSFTKEQRGTIIPNNKSIGNYPLHKEYCQLVMCYFYLLKDLNFLDIHNKISEIPKLVMKLEFQDIEGLKYKNHFKLEIITYPEHNNTCRLRMDLMKK